MVRSAVEEGGGGGGGDGVVFCLVLFYIARRVEGLCGLTASDSICSELVSGFAAKRRCWISMAKDTVDH